MGLLLPHTRGVALVVAVLAHNLLTASSAATHEDVNRALSALEVSYQKLQHASRGAAAGGSLKPAAASAGVLAPAAGGLKTVPDGGESYGACETKADCGSPKMACIQSVCRCPVLFMGEQCDQPRPPQEPWCLTPLKEWPSVGPVYQDLAGSTLDFSSCAVVGSSGQMKGSGLGKEIDAHTAVFRFNEAPASKLYRGDVGSFTTLRFQNRDRSGFAEVKGEICVVRAGKWSRGQDSNGKCRFIQMPDVVEKYVDGHWKMNRQGEHWPKHDPGRPWFSNGFAGIVFALHMCARVDVYGFTFDAGYYFPKYKGPAKSWGRRGGFIRPPAKDLDRRHSWIREARCLRTWVGAGEWRHSMGEEIPSQVTIQVSNLAKADTAAPDPTPSGAGYTKTSAGDFGEE